MCVGCGVVVGGGWWKHHTQVDRKSTWSEWSVEVNGTRTKKGVSACACLLWLLFHRKNEFIECGLKLLVFFAAAGAISAF